MLHNRKPQSSTPNLLRMTLIHPVESLKHPILIFPRNSNPRILNHDLHLLRRLLQKDTHTTIIPVILNRIITNIINSLLQKSPDRLHLHRLSTDIKMHIHLICLLLQTVKRILTNLINIHRLPYIRRFLLIKL